MARTSAPKNLDRLRVGQRTNEDDMVDLLRDLRRGREVDIADPLNPEAEAEPATDDQIEASDIAPQPKQKPVPEVILRLLDGPAKGELLEVARLLDETYASSRYLIFVTPIGDVRCKIHWTSCAPDEIKPDGMLFVKLRSADMVFTPKPGAQFDVGFEDYPGVVSVTCLAEPQRLYPGIDLLCFMVHNSPVEKNGKLNEGSPSVVSGRPSDDVENGEPVVRGERTSPLEKNAADTLAGVAVRDWDRTRD